MEAIWKKVKSTLKSDIPVHSFRMWIEPLGIQEGADGEIILTCPNPFFKKRIQEQYLDRITSQILAQTGKEHRISLEVKNGLSILPGASENTVQLALPRFNVRPHAGRLFRKDFTFDQFVVGKSNDFAYCAALSLAAKKHHHQNTLFLMAKTGLGKSHLSQAAGQFILSEFPSKRVFYITGEDFTTEMVQAFRHGALDEFKKKYRDGCDVLLLEDIQYLSGKQRTQEELAMTLEFLIESNRKIIFSSCLPPAEIPKLNDKLRSCLASGLISSIEPPDFKTRFRILKRKCNSNGHRIPEDVLTFLASELTEDVRQLESGLIGVSARASLLGTRINLNLAESVVKNISGARRPITIATIKKLVCDQFNVSVADVVSKSRKQCFVRPRQIAMYLSRRYTDSPLQAIGKSFNRYHATALHAVAAVEKEIRKNPAIKQQVAYLCHKLETGRF